MIQFGTDDTVDELCGMVYNTDMKASSGRAARRPISMPSSAAEPHPSLPGLSQCSASLARGGAEEEGVNHYDDDRAVARCCSFSRAETTGAR